MCLYIAWLGPLWIGGNKLSGTEFRWKGLIGSYVPKNGDIESDWYDTEPNTLTDDGMAIAAGDGVGGWFDVNATTHYNALCEAQ